MPKKLSKTALNIRSINSYIQTVARVFGTGSAEYQAATVPLKQFDIRDKHVNGQTIVQIKNTAENRKKHQTIRAIKNRRKPVNILKRPYVKAMKEAQKKENIKNKNIAGGFTRWYAELQKTFEDLSAEVYALAEALEKLGLPELDWSRAWRDNVYRASEWETVFNNGGNEVEPNSEKFQEWVDNIPDVEETPDGVKVDPNTGEVVEFDNSDYDNYDMGFD